MQVVALEIVDAGADDGDVRRGGRDLLIGLS
jgi:hypothetical protein